MKYYFHFFRCVAWHPHVAKVALAMKDDTVQIALTSSNIKPLLKHKKQKQVLHIRTKAVEGLGTI